ncbi:MAG: Ribonuclease P protein component [Parcubacteria group bacterium GW2011_GWC2_42_12]|uniref:Ribonuclease P protein component n=1 Tax=Candidatus Falkowbacteria bacterium GW2011_GWA2_41_14 TaxID=1618635 RepID=A0A0G0XVF4_9BACT|nr:MAG: Ribonuclease P protein component [Candidatus Falkowbacteria bacterium GW2011_GWA2_41_14]KKS34828.1 MAG: Ribonuclease P protein component [Parcubacteria group bacterium GW2011_GWC2_42_12]
MLVKSHRLVKQKDFEKVFKQGRPYYTKFLGAMILANQLDFNRFGIVISSKVSKKATERNKLKRRIKQAIRGLDKKLKSGLDLAIMARPCFINQEYKIVAGELERIFTKLKIFK